jgi:hypothetical protein
VANYDYHRLHPLQVNIYFTVMAMSGDVYPPRQIPVYNENFLIRYGDEWGRLSSTTQHPSAMSGEDQRTSTKTSLSAFNQGGEEYDYDHADHSTVESEEAISIMAPATHYPIPPLPLLPRQDRCHQHPALGEL